MVIKKNRPMANPSRFRVLVPSSSCLLYISIYILIYRDLCVVQYAVDDQGTMPCRSMLAYPIPSPRKSGKIHENYKPPHGHVYIHIK